MKYALVTGADHGVGLSFCFTLSTKSVKINGGFLGEGVWIKRQRKSRG